MTSGTVSRMILDDTLPGGPVERTFTYVAPWVKRYRLGEEYFSTTSGKSQAEQSPGFRLSASFRMVISVSAPFLQRLLS